MQEQNDKQPDWEENNFQEHGSQYYRHLQEKIDFFKLLFGLMCYLGHT
jgi:Na+(H+)/acetate symporter ActP